MVKNMASGLLIGALFGASLAAFIATQQLKLIFALFLLLVAWRMLLSKSGESGKGLPHKATQAAAGLFIGAISAILGVGGGTMSVPLLHHFSLNLRAAVATASACGFPIALAGTFGFMYFGWAVSDLPEGSLGYVYLPAVALISISSVTFAPLGAYMAHRLPVKLIKRLFALILLPVSLRLLGIL